MKCVKLLFLVFSNVFRSFTSDVQSHGSLSTISPTLESGSYSHTRYHLIGINGAALTSFCCSISPSNCHKSGVSIHWRSISVCLPIKCLSHQSGRWPNRSPCFLFSRIPGTLSSIELYTGDHSTSAYTSNTTSLAHHLD